MEVVNKECDFESLKQDIEETKNEYIHNKFEREKIESDYIRKRNDLIYYASLFDDISKKDIIKNILNSSNKEELAINKKILKEYKKLINDGFYIEMICNSESIKDLLEKDYNSLKSVMFYKISCIIIPIIQISITIFFNYEVLFFPYESIIRYFGTILGLYIPACVFDYLKEGVKDDMKSLNDLKYTLKEENKYL